MRKQQIIVIHGGTTFNTHEDYISYLKSKEITIEKLKIRKEWKDDPVVRFEQIEKYKQALPSAKEIIFHDRGHFNQEQFPEIIELIKKI